MSLVPRAGAARPPSWRGAGRRGLVLRDLVALGLEERILDVLGEEARIVAAPGADHDAPAPLGEARSRCIGRAAAPAASPSAFSASRRVTLQFVFDMFLSLRKPGSFIRRRPAPASRGQPTSTASPTAGAAASPRLGSCRTTRSAGDRRTCSSSTAPR